MLVKTETIAGKNIYIIDNMLPQEEVLDFYNITCDLPFSRKEKDSHADEYPIFSIDFNIEKFETELLIGKTARDLLNQFIAIEEMSLYRAYINMCHYGDMAYPHRDCSVNKNDITVLYYVNKEWDYSWGGETLFYENKETKLGILPRPGRVLIFRGGQEHKVCIPIRICKKKRFKIAIK